MHKSIFLYRFDNKAPGHVFRIFIFNNKKPKLRRNKILKSYK